MPGFDHELKVRLFQNNPELAPLMLRDTIGFPVPDYARVELGCTDHTKLKPVPFKSDSVVVLYDEHGTKQMAIIAEVQHKKDSDKPYSWPLYVATVWEIIRCPVRLMWEELMATGTYEWQSDFARKYVGQGREEGREQGREEGLLLGKHDALLRLLERRGLSVSEHERSRINACDDLEQLDLWFDRAITATAAEELFD